MNLYSTFCFLLLILFFAACEHPPVKKPKPVVIIEKSEFVNQNVTKIIAGTLTTFPPSQTLILADDSLLATKSLIAFYALRNYEPLWTNQGKLTIQGDSLLGLLRNAGNDGLISSDYHLQKLDSLLKHEKGSHKFDANKLSEADLLLTNAFFTYSVHISTGRLNKDSLVREWHPQNLDTNLVTLLNRAFSHNTIKRTIHSLEPQSKRYQLFKLALRNFLFEFNGLSWDSLKLNEPNTLTKRLKERLLASHDLMVTEADSLTSDSILVVRGIKNFQCRHNLIEDGKIGKLTLKALQRSKADYISQLQLNMERCRWQNLPVENRYIWVNIPKYELILVDEDTIYLKSRVIVGSTTKNTPVLKSKITNFLIYPYWNVPYNIATKELLPIIQRDSSYLHRKNFEVLNGFNQVVDPKYIVWKKYNEKFFPWRIRQKTGDENSLGILKFNFSNKYGVYLHDTDNHSLFNKEMRALSHGCVRVEKFLDLAKYLIREDSVKYPVSELLIDLVKEEQKYIYMRKPIPIYIDYYTIEVTEQGAVFFFIDVYEKDEKMKRALFKR